MSEAELDLLAALDAILTEGSVTAAAGRLGISVPAMSRHLKRAREVFGDPLMVRSGNGLVPTPRCLALRGRVHQIVADARSVIRESSVLDLDTLSRRFVIVGNDLLFRPATLEAQVRALAPRARCAFLLDCSEHISLRTSPVDLIVGFRDFSPADEPDTKVEVLRRERLVGIARVGHPALVRGMSAERYLAAEHVVSSRRGRFGSIIDRELEVRGIHRNVVTSSPSLWSTIWFLHDNDLLGAVVESVASGLEHFGIATFQIPFDIDTSTDICMSWHRRHDADPGHRWLREMVRSVAVSSAELAASA